MGRKALHTQEQVFEAANQLVVNGQEVTPTMLRNALGGGSLTTIYRHLEAWEASRKMLPKPVMIAMPNIVKLAFEQAWQAVSAEASREIAEIREKTDIETKTINRRLEEAIAAIASLQTELARVHAVSLATQADADNLRAQLAIAAEKIDESYARERARIEEATLAKADAARLSDQLKEQKVRSVEVISKLEKGKQTLKAELTASREEALTLSTNLARAQAELEVLRTQVASLNTTIRSLALPGEKREKGGAS